MAWRRQYGRQTPMAQARARAAQPVPSPGYIGHTGMGMHAGPYNTPPFMTGPTASPWSHPNGPLSDYAMPGGKTPNAWNHFKRSFTRRGYTGGEFGRRYRRGLGSSYFLQTAAITTALGVGSTIGQAVSKSAEWGTASGHEEDYAGGAVFGARLGIAQAIGGLGMEAVGGLLGSAFGPMGSMAGQIIGSIGGNIAGDYFFKRSAYEHGLQTSYATAGAIAKRKVQFGRGFRDTEEAYTMRQAAVQEMAGSLLNARQYLGNEAYFLHR